MSVKLVTNNLHRGPGDKNRDKEKDKEKDNGERSRHMHGAFSVSSLIAERAVLSFVLVDQNAAVAGEATHDVPEMVYNEAVHGPLYISLGNLLPLLSAEEESSLQQLSGASGRDVRTDLSGCQKLDCSLQWQPPPGLVLNSISGTLCVTMTVPDQQNPNGASPPRPRVATQQFIPFCCFLEQRSSFSTADKYVNFGEVPVGKKKTASASLTNRSTEDLPYIAMVVSVERLSRSIGQVEIKARQTGVLAPAQSCDVQLEFSATSLGRFEQFLWVSNLNDRSDQSRVSLLASVILSQSRFVTFPDLDESGDESGGGGGRLRHLDLGLVQVAPGVLAAGHAGVGQTPPAADFLYRLRINNVSDKQLSVTAVSNLKLQLQIYSNEACTAGALFYPLAQNATTFLYILIKAPNSDKGRESKDGGTGLSWREKEAGRRKAAVGRELVGGIRLVFFTPLDGEESSKAAADREPQKLFEISVAIRATVGFSVLHARHDGPSQHWCRPLPPRDANSAVSWHYVSGSIMLENLSPTFPARYAYVSSPGVSAPLRVLAPSGGALDPLFESFVRELDASASAGQQQRRREGSTRVAVVDSVSTHVSAAPPHGTLQPLEKKIVRYCVAYKVHADGFGSLDTGFLVRNVDTGEQQALDMTVFLDPGLLTIAEAETPSGRSEVAGGGIDLTRALLVSASPIWLADARERDISRDKEKEKDKDKDKERGEKEKSKRRPFEVLGASHLCSWTLRNTGSKSLSVTPVADQPVVVRVCSRAGGSPLESQSPKEVVIPSFGTSRSTSSLPRSMSHSKLALSSLSLTLRDRPTSPQLSAAALPPPGLHSSSPTLASTGWGRRLQRCGEAVVVPSGASVRVDLWGAAGAIYWAGEGAVSPGGTAPAGSSGESSQPLWDQASLLDGGAVVASNCTIAFLPTLEAASLLGGSAGTGISSARFFEPPRSSSLLAESAEQGSGLVPVLSYTLVSLSLVLPRIRVPQTTYALGTMRLAGAARGAFDVLVESACDVAVPLALASLPPWLALEGSATSPSLRLPPRGVLTIPLTVRAPPRAQATPPPWVLDHSVSLVMTPAGPPRQAERGQAERRLTSGKGADIRVVLSIDCSRPYQLTCGGRALEEEMEGQAVDEGAEGGDTRRQRLELRGGLLVPPPLSSDADDVWPGAGGPKASPAADRADSSDPLEGPSAPSARAILRVYISNSHPCAIWVEASIDVSAGLRDVVGMGVGAVAAAGVGAPSGGPNQTSCSLLLPRGGGAEVAIFVCSLPGSRLSVPSGNLDRLGTLRLSAFQREDESAAAAAPVPAPLSLALEAAAPSYLLLRLDPCPPTAAIDSTVVSILGRLIPGCTLSAGSRTRFDFIASGPPSLLLPLPLAPGAVAGADTATATAAHQATPRPLLHIRKNHVSIELHNPSPTSAAIFRIDSRSLRRSGMRLRLGDDHLGVDGRTDGAAVDAPEDEGPLYETYDTIQVLPVVAAAAAAAGEGEAQVSVIAPGGSVALTLQLVPGSGGAGGESVSGLAATGDSAATASAGAAAAAAVQALPGMHLLAVLPILITDVAAPAHPPLRLLAVLQSDVPVPALVTAPVSATNRVKQQLGALTDKGATGLMLRGVTPLPERGQYEIPLGQQAQRNDSIEWLLTIENPSSEACCCSITVVTAGLAADHWVMLGQNRGRVEAKGSLSVSPFAPIFAF